MTARRASARQPARVPPTPPALPWEDILANFSDAVVVSDEEGRIALFNQAAEELTGLPHGRVLGQPFGGLFADSPLLADMVRRVRDTGQRESRREESLRWRFRTVPARITCHPIWDAERRLRGTALVVHDLTHQVKLEESVRRSESLASLGTLVAGLAHEIRNPLAGIKGAAQLLEGRLAAQADLREYTGVITREANRLSALVEDLLVMGTPARPRLERLNIHRVLQHVLLLLEGEPARRGLQVVCEFDPSLPDIQGDDAQLSQVFLNLLKNAMEAMSADGPPAADRNAITLRTRMETDFRIHRDRAPTGKFLRVEVADQGCGIDPAHAESIFEPFFTTKARGTGLGLAISLRIVGEHGGAIRARPNRPAGTVLTVTLPIASD